MEILPDIGSLVYIKETSYIGETEVTFAMTQAKVIQVEEVPRCRDCANNGHVPVYVETEGCECLHVHTASLVHDSIMPIIFVNQVMRLNRR